MAVGAQQGLARHAEILQLQLVADAVARLGEYHAVPLGYAFDECMVIRILEPCLQGVVVDICHGQFGLDALHFHGLQLQVYHSTRGVLCQCLVDFDGDLIPGFQFPFHQVILQNFVR